MSDPTLHIKIAGDVSAIKDALAQLQVGLNKVAETAAAAGRKAAGGLSEAEKATKREAQASAELVVKLQQQAAAYGLAGSKLLELNKQRDLAKVKTDAERRAVEAAYNTMITKARAAETAQAKAGNTITSAMNAAKTAIVGLATSFIALQSIRTVISFGDQFAQLNGVLKLATNSTEEFLVAQRGVFEIAQKTRAPVAETAQTYGALERTTKKLGLSQADLLRTLETVNKAIGSTPVNAQSAQASLIQFGQALGGDFKAGSQELNSILEQTPGLAVAIAKGLGVQTSELKKMGEEGKLSTELVVRGLLRISDEVDKTFSQVPRTVSGAFQQIKNQLLFTIGSTDMKPLIESLEELRKIVTDPAVVGGLVAIATAIVKVTSVAVTGASKIADFAKFIGESFAAAFNGPGGDDLVRMSDRIIELRDKLATLKDAGRNAALSNPFSIFGRADEIKATETEIRKLEKAYADAQKRIIEAAHAADAKKKSDAALTMEQKKQAEAAFNAAKAAAEQKRVDEEANKERAKRQKQIQDTIADLENEAVTYGLAEGEVVAYQLALMGASDAEIQRGRAAATALANLKKETEATKDRLKAEEDLAKSLEDSRARLAELGGDSVASKMLQLTRQRDELLAQIAKVNPADQKSIDLVNRLFDVESARTRADAIKGEADRLIRDLQAKESSVSQQISAGIISQSTGAEQLKVAREETIAQLVRQRDALTELYKVAPTPETLAAIQEFDQSIGEIATRNASGFARAMMDLRTQLQQLQDNFAGDTINALTDSLSNFFVSILDGSKSAKEALLDFVRSFAAAMLQIAARALATFLVLQILDAIYPGLGKATLAVIGAGSAAVKHTGGVVGQGGVTRSVNPLLFGAAPRYHMGGVAGLAPNEVPAILQKGEEVITRNDPRNVLNGGGMQMQDRGTRVVNVFDAAFVPDQMDSAAGEKVILNVIGKNPGRVKQLLQG